MFTIFLRSRDRNRTYVAHIQSVSAEPTQRPGINYRLFFSLVLATQYRLLCLHAANPLPVYKESTSSLTTRMVDCCELCKARVRFALLSSREAIVRKYK